MLTPLSNPLTPQENLYNESQIRTRNVVERQYGVWKRRFLIIAGTMITSIERTKVIIVATAVLHNIALDQKDPLPTSIMEDNEINEDNTVILPVGNDTRRRNLINNYFTNLLKSL